MSDFTPDCDNPALEARLQELQARFEGLAAASFEAVVVHDRGTILMTNQAAAELFGYPCDELVGMSILALAAPESREHVAERALSGSEEPYEAIGLRKDGSRVRGVLRGKQIPYQGRMVRVTAIRDISAELRAAEEIARRTAELQHVLELDRLKSNFVSTVSHELRTPLTSIVGYAEFLEDGLGGPLTTLQQEYVEQIRRSAGRLQGLVDDLLDYARLEAGTLKLRPQPLDLASAIKEVVEGLRPLIHEAALTLDLALPDRPVEVMGDVRRIGQVITNLVGNAIKFTPAGGRIELRLREEAGHVRVEVADTGVGIPAEHVPHLFEKFYQVDPSDTRAHGGAGLGLSIVRALVEAHAGEVGATSELGRGTTFWFTLPREAPPIPPAAQPPAG